MTSRPTVNGIPPGLLSVLAGVVGNQLRALR